MKVRLSRFPHSKNFPICLILKVRNSQVTFVENPQMKLNRLKKQNHGYSIHTWSDKAFKGTLVNGALSSLYEGWLEMVTYSPSNHLRKNNPNKNFTKGYKGGYNSESF